MKEHRLRVATHRCAALSGELLRTRTDLKSPTPLGWGRRSRGYHCTRPVSHERIIRPTGATGLNTPLPNPIPCRSHDRGRTSSSQRR